MNPSPANHQNLSKNPSNTISIEAVSSSINNLTKTFHRRQKWSEFYNPSTNTRNTDPNAWPWRTHLVNLLESGPAHLITILLLAADLVVSVIELSASELKCRQARHASSSNPPLMWVHWAGIAILAVLVVKTGLLAVGLGGEFFKRGGDVADGMAAAVALVLEVGLERLGGGLVVVVSLWRVIRVAESAFELGDDSIEAQIEDILAQFEGIKEMKGGLERALEEKERVILTLQEELELESTTPYQTPM